MDPGGPSLFRLLGRGGAGAGPGRSGFLGPLNPHPDLENIFKEATDGGRLLVSPESALGETPVLGTAR